jgi:hypothetical protein
MALMALQIILSITAKDSNDWKVFDAPEWLAAMCSHVPNRGEQMVRYYGWYSKGTRGKRQKRTEDDTIAYNHLP